MGKVKEFVMKKYERFAVAMSILLFEMRTEDLNDTILYYEDQHGVQKEMLENYIDKALSDHKETIIERLRLSVLAAVTDSPNNYMQKHSGQGDSATSEYVYSSLVYDHAYLVDEFIMEQYHVDHPEMKTIQMCPECNSDNVQVKAWVRPNQNNQLVDYLNDQVTDGFCDDCHEHVIVETAEVNVRHQVEGFQVRFASGANQIHPKMANDKSLYSLLDADAMLRDSTVGERWKLKTIWTADIVDPVVMFDDGDPRDQTSSF